MELQIKYVYEKDVVVIGGGTAGVFAAISASDAGAKTLLVEKNGMLGGTMTAGGVNFPGLFYAWGKRILGGHAWEIINEIMREGLSKYPEIKYFRQEHWIEQFSINQFSTEYVLDKNCKKYNVDVMLHTMLAGIKENQDYIEVLLCGKEGLICIKAKCLVDATGDANAVKMAGYKIFKSESLQPASLICSFDGYDVNNINMEELEEKFIKGEKNNLLPEWLSFGEFRDKLVNQRGDIHIICDANADTSQGKTKMEQKARENVQKLLSFIRTIKGCENATVKSQAYECALRETSRIDGEYMITVDDYIKGVVFDDAICYAYYPIDLHIKGGVHPKHLQDGKTPTIPLRALIPKKSTRIIAVGRCISSDTLSNSGLRVQVPCMAMGQVGGIVAALVAKNNCSLKELPFNEITKEMNRQNCIVPQRLS